MDRNIIEFIKSQHSVISYANTVLGCPVFKEGDRCVSPLRADAKNPTSFIVFNDKWADWGQGLTGDIIDLCAIAKHNGDIGQAIRDLAGEFFPSIGQDYFSYSQKLSEKISYWHSQLRQTDIDYLHSRRIHDDTIERLQLGFSEKRNRLMIPYFKNNHVVYFAGRDRSGEKDKSKYEKAKIDEYNDHVPWGLHTLTRDFDALHPENFTTSTQGKRIHFKDFLCVLEGAFDAFSFEQEGFHVLSPIGGYFNKYQVSTFLAAAKNHKAVFICFDNDASGHAFQKRMSEICFSHRIPFVCGHVPAGIKDVSDYYAAGGSIPDLVENAEKGLISLSKTFPDDENEKFADFLRSASRYAHKTDIQEVIASAVQFNIEWRKALLQECSKAPKESLIVEELAKSHDLKYIVNNGFFEYSGGVWNKIPDEFVGKYIDDALGFFSTGGRISSIMSFLKTRLSSDEEFNRKNIFNFVNGTLDLETLKLMPHSKTFMSDVQAPYNFDEKAEAKLWKKFLNQVTEFDDQKLLLLQEIAGYVLFPDCSFEKAFMLLGEGSNGKSVFINTLANVFGKNNCSNVSISDLMSPFEPVRLLHSIVNFSTEMKSNIKGAEDKFKQVVSGEKISAAFKGKDAFTFSPRAKWVFAANSFISSNDITYGFSRRVIFVSFPHTFTGDEIDRDLTSKLSQELPGIFNWVLEGYKRLKKNGSFTLTDENTTLEKEFMQGINPVYVFAEEKLMSITYAKKTTQELYELYTPWCKEAGFSALNRVNFTRKLRTVLSRLRPDVKYVASHSYFSFNVPNITAEFE